MSARVSSAVCPGTDVMRSPFPLIPFLFFRSERIPSALMDEEDLAFRPRVLRTPSLKDWTPMLILSTKEVSLSVSAETD